MDKIIVIDTETNWDNNVMSIGTVIADAKLLEPIEKNYYVIVPDYLKGGMYSHVLFPKGIKKVIQCSRDEAINSIINRCYKYRISSVYAYNAVFDRRLLSELSNMKWYDIMKIAANVQFNKKIPPNADICSSGRLRSGYGEESIYRMLTGDNTYTETHNALFDALDELTIMKLLNYPIENFIQL